MVLEQLLRLERFLAATALREVLVLVLRGAVGLLDVLPCTLLANTTKDAQSFRPTLTSDIALYYIQVLRTGRTSSPSFV